VCAAETASTLLFVASAKSIRNKATINVNYRGDVPTMQVRVCVWSIVQSIGCLHACVCKCVCVCVREVEVISPR
jgi:hypothetical protein